MPQPGQMGYPQMTQLAQQSNQMMLANLMGHFGPQGNFANFGQFPQARIKRRPSIATLQHYFNNFQIENIKSKRK